MRIRKRRIRAPPMIPVPTETAQVAVPVVVVEERGDWQG
jgi:hypothetical protein